VSDPRVELVAHGYDVMADRFLEWARRIEGDPRLEWLDDLARRLPDGADVLELGCGAGEPCTRLLSERFRVTGVDASSAQIERAAVAAPEARLVLGDFLEVDLPGSSFDAVCSFYVLNHVPREYLGALVLRTAGWLRPGGLFMNAFSASDNPGWTGEWLGTTMFFAGSAPAENRRLVEAAGLEVLRDEIVTFVEPEPEPGDVSFQWIMARR
jgi:cyclopropane fatty-acyl-phospholipid synthase-like methyltransferase